MLLMLVVQTMLCAAAARCCSPTAVTTVILISNLNPVASPPPSLRVPVARGAQSRQCSAFCATRVERHNLTRSSVMIVVSVVLINDAQFARRLLIIISLASR